MRQRGKNMLLRMGLIILFVLCGSGCGIVSQWFRGEWWVRNAWEELSSGSLDILFDGDGSLTRRFGGSSTAHALAI